MSEGVSCTTAPAEPSALIIITHRGTVTTQSGQPDGETSCSKHFFLHKIFSLGQPGDPDIHYEGCGH